MHKILDILHKYVIILVILINYFYMNETEKAIREIELSLQFPNSEDMIDQMLQEQESHTEELKETEKPALSLEQKLKLARMYF